MSAKEESERRKAMLPRRAVISSGRRLVVLRKWMWILVRVVLAEIERAANCKLEFMQSDVPHFGPNVPYGGATGAIK